MASRSGRAVIAAETVSITQRGSFAAPSGANVSVGAAVAAAVGNTRLIVPGETDALVAQAGERLEDRAFSTAFEVRNETTFAGARRLVDRFGPGKAAALNFASAKNPGGGFLGGSQAQEESLARASALFACLENQRRYYDTNRAERSLLYTDHIIVSPRVPVFRDDEDVLLEKPWEVTIITSPAPNKGAISNNNRDELKMVEPTFRRRIQQILSAAVVFDQNALVLGAWGCGVFRNDPSVVAKLFGEFLRPGGKFGRAFESVVFSVLDRDGQTIGPFEKVFGAQ